MTNPSSHIKIIEQYQSRGESRYEVKGELGGGGMGDVYRVWDRDTNRDLAAKILKFTYPRALHYVKREFRAVASLSHPNLVALYDLHFEGEDYFYTMEYVDGTDLYVYVNTHNRVINDPSILRSPARLDRLRRAIIQLLRGLAFLHHHGRVHRDIKPSNILVDRDGRVRLVDFGIVKELIPGGEGQSLSQVFGTSTYFSPEQSLGSHVGPEADLYSVGVLLYELLSGRPPFTGSSVDVALKHRTEEPSPLADSSDLADVCMALLRKEPSNRPTARQALERLNVNTDFRVQTQEFIGRVGARRTLHEAIEETRNGTGRIVVVEGDSGLGKTALVENFGHEARLLGATIFTGTCVQRDHVPMRGLDTLVERLAEAYRKETARVLRRLDEGERAAIINGFGFLGELLPQEEHGTDDGRSSAASGLHRWLSALASTRLLVLVIEHLHLADDEVCDVLENLLSGGEPPPVLVILTVRSDRTMTGDRLSDLLDFLYTIQQTRRIALDPFSLPEVRQYLREHMRPTPHWLAEYILDETEGNPLFVSAMVEALKADVDSPPPSLKETVRRQLEGLGQDARSLLCALALNGEPISIATVCDAAGLESDRAYDALRILSAEDIADLATMGDGRAFVAGAHEPLLALVRTHVDEPKTWHRRLAAAHQKNKGPAHLIEHHWRQADDVEQASVFARQEAERARADGIHPRAVEMIRLSLSLAAPDEERTELYTNLVDSLARCGRHAEAADAIGELEAFDPDMAYLLRGRRCHFHLLAGHLAEFERHAIELPRRAHVPLAGALVEFLPDKAAEYVRHGDDVWAHLVQIQLLAQSSRDDDHRQAKKLLQDCDESVTDEGPEWAGEYALACVHYMRAVGASNAAVDLIQKTLKEIGEHQTTDTLLTSRLQLLLGQALLDGGHVSAARREVGHLLRMARKRNLSSIRALARILQSRATLAGGDTRVADAFIEEAGRHWPAEPPPYLMRGWRSHGRTML